MNDVHLGGLKKRLRWERFYLDPKGLLLFFALNFFQLCKFVDDELVILNNKYHTFVANLLFCVDVI